MSPMTPSQTDNESPHFDFGDIARDVYPHAPGRRLARMLDVAPRLAQRWVAGEIQPTAEAVAYLDKQQRALRSIDLIGELEGLIEKWSAAGADNEVIAAHLAQMHERLTDRTLE